MDPEIKAVEYNPRWIPIGRSARGRDYLCLDMDPSEKGHLGQIILTAVDCDDHFLIARSKGQRMPILWRFGRINGRHI